MLSHDIFVGAWQVSAVNCLSMAIGLFGWGRPPHYLANVMGVTAGIHYRRDERSIEFYQGSMSAAECLDEAFATLAFQVERHHWNYNTENSTALLDQLVLHSQAGALIIGPLDCRYLSYRQSKDHSEANVASYLLLIQANMEEAVVHDPEGYAYAVLPMQQLLTACLSSVKGYGQSRTMYRITGRLHNPNPKDIITSILRRSLLLSLGTGQAEGSVGALKRLQEDIQNSDGSSYNLKLRTVLQQWNGTLGYLAAARLFKEEQFEQLSILRSQQAQIAGKLCSCAHTARWQELDHCLNALISREEEWIQRLQDTLKKR